MYYIISEDSVSRRFMVGNTDTLEIVKMTENEMKGFLKSGKKLLKNVWQDKSIGEFVKSKDENTIIRFKGGCWDRKSSVDVFHNGFFYENVHELKQKNIHSIFVHPETGFLTIKTDVNKYIFDNRKAIYFIDRLLCARIAYTGVEMSLNTYKRRLLFC